MHLLPQTRKVGYRIICNKPRYCIQNSANRFYNFSFKVSNYYYHQSQFLVQISSNIAKNIHKCSRTNCENEESEGMIISSSRLEMEDRSDVFRNSLYPISNDPVIIKLKSCDSLTRLINIIKDNSLNLISKHYCQFILVLWDLKKQYEDKYCYHHIVKSDTYLSHLADNSLYLESKIENGIHPTLAKALDHISADIETLSVPELVYSVMYSNRLGINLKNPSVQNILMKINKLLTNEDIEVFPLPLLSRLSIVFVERDELWAKLYLIKLLPFVYKYFDQCSNVEDFKALTISMLSTVPYLRKELIVEYEALTDELLRNGVLNRHHVSAVVKAITLLNYIYYKPSARQMIYRLLQMLSGQVNKIFIPHLLDLKQVLLVNLEPRYTLAEVDSVQHTPPGFFEGCGNFTFITLPHNQESSIIIKDLIKKSNHLDGLLNLYYHLTTAHLDACHMFWEKVASLMPPDESFYLQRVCVRYLMFTSRMGTYRNNQFEKHILGLITKDLVTGSTACQPVEFSRLAAFVLSFEYETRGATSLFANIIPRLISMSGQLSPNSCYLLSIGLKQAKISQTNKKALQMYLQLDSALSARTREILQAQELLSLTTYNALLRTSINRRGTLESDLLSDILKRCEQLDWSQLTSRSLRNLVYNMFNTDSLVPTALDRMSEYCLDNQLCVTCDTVAKLAFLCYYLGHSPTSGPSFWAFTADLVAREHKLLNGLILLQVTLALSFFNHLPASLTRVIFSVDFLERLDNEIRNCFSKDKYPVRVRNTLMQLNRSACLDHPEAAVPWFHSKFCEEQRALGAVDARPKSLLFTDVLSTLTGLVGDLSYIGQNTFTPYGYTVDIQLNLDAALKPVPVKESENVAHKLALLLLYGDNYTSHKVNLKGYHQMKQRHLEILGYRVISISAALWNTMWMSEPVAKHEYLRKLIWPS